MKDFPSRSLRPFLLTKPSCKQGSEHWNFAGVQGPEGPTDSTPAFSGVGSPMHPSTHAPSHLSIHPATQPRIQPDACQQPATYKPLTKIKLQREQRQQTTASRGRVARSLQSHSKTRLCLSPAAEATAAFSSPSGGNGLEGSQPHTSFRAWAKGQSGSVDPAGRRRCPTDRPPAPRRRLQATWPHSGSSGFLKDRRGGGVGARD